MSERGRCSREENDLRHGRSRQAEGIDALPFAKPLRLGKYTTWATKVRFTMEDLHTLVRIVGEFRAGAGAIFDVIYDSPTEGGSRACVALQGLEQMVIGERCSPDGWGLRITRRRGYLRAADLPEATRRRLQAAAPEVKWEDDFVLRVPEGYEAGGKDASGRWVFALFSEEGAVSYLGADRKRGEAPEPSVFPEPMQRRLAEDKSARWAVGRVLAPEHLRHLLWLAGEFACRAGDILKLLDAQRHRLVGERRAVLALELMCRLEKGERFDVDELERRFARGRAHLTLEDLPEVRRAELRRASPQSTWDSVWMRSNVCIVLGNGPGELSIGARLAPGRPVAIWTYVGLGELPAGVQAAVSAGLAGKGITFVAAVGPTLGAVEWYEIDFREGAERHTLAVSADGDKTWMIDPPEHYRY